MNLPGFDVEAWSAVIDGGGLQVGLARVEDFQAPAELSAPERERAGRFVDEESRRAFIAGRTLVRRVLGRWVDRVELELDVHGKPGCRDVRAPRFNLSHTGTWLAAGFVRSGGVGVDVESATRAVPDATRIAARVFSPAERERLGRGEATFLELWVGQEAVRKAIGTGMRGGGAWIDAHGEAARQGLRVEGFRVGGLVGAACGPETDRMAVCRVMSSD